MDYEKRNVLAQTQQVGVAGLSGSREVLPKENRQPLVGVYLDNTERELAFQRETIQMLMDRLNPIMSLEPPNDTLNKQTGPPDHTCSMANVIQNQWIQIQQHNSILTSILRRLEL